MGEVVRLEVTVDGTVVPQPAPTGPPYRLRLDAERLAGGGHELRVVAVLRDGRRVEQTVPFQVQRLSEVRVVGLAPGDTVSGLLDLRVEVGLPAAGEPARRSPWPRVVGAVVILGGVWALFALLSPVGNVLAPVGGRAGQVPAAAAATLITQGQGTYSQKCSGCHGPDGKGVPGAFPPLAGNSALQDARHVVTTVHDGLSGPIVVNGQRYQGQMPAFGDLTTGELAAVASYVRERLGNHFGAVSEEQVHQMLAAPSPPVDESLLAEGRELYGEKCVSCHQERGGGVPGAALPPLAGNPHLESIELIAHAVQGGQAGPVLVNGKEYNGQMPPVPGLSARQVAALATYVRNSFGNHFGGATVEQVERALGTSPAPGGGPGGH